MRITVDLPKLNLTATPGGRVEMFVGPGMDTVTVSADGTITATRNGGSAPPTITINILHLLSNLEQTARGHARVGSPTEGVRDQLVHTLQVAADAWYAEHPDLLACGPDVIA